jgi:hypothetical protein
MESHLGATSIVDFIKILKSLTTFSQSVEFICENKGLTLKAIHPAGHAYANLHLNASFFPVYTIDESLQVISCSVLLKPLLHSLSQRFPLTNCILKLTKSHFLELSFYFSGISNKLIKGAVKRVVIKCNDVDREVMFGDVEYSSNHLITFNATILNQLLNGHFHRHEDLTFEISDKHLTLTSSEETEISLEENYFKTSISLDAKCCNVEVEDEGMFTFDLKIFKSIIRSASLLGLEVFVKFSLQHSRLLITYTGIDNHFECSYVVALIMSSDLLLGEMRKRKYGDSFEDEEEEIQSTPPRT